MAKVDWARCSGEIERLYSSGMSASDIVKILGGISKATVVLYLGKRGLMRSAKESTKLNIQQGKYYTPIRASPLAPRILELYKKGYSARMIAKELDGAYSQPVISRFLRERKRSRSVSEALLLARKLGRCKEQDARTSERQLGPLSRNWKGGKWTRGRAIKRSRERGLFREALRLADYTCSITGQRGGRLSVHHIKPVWSHPQDRYEQGNLTVVRFDIHQHFHRVCGQRTTAEAWAKYVRTGRCWEVTAEDTRARSALPFTAGS